MDHTNHVRLTNDELIAENIEGATVYGVDEEKVGTVDHVHGAGSGSTVIVDVGGFLRIYARRKWRRACSNKLE